MANDFLYNLFKRKTPEDYSTMVTDDLNEIESNRNGSIQMAPIEYSQPNAKPVPPVEDSQFLSNIGAGVSQSLEQLKSLIPNFSDYLPTIVSDEDWQKAQRAKAIRRVSEDPSTAAYYGISPENISNADRKNVGLPPVMTPVPKSLDLNVKKVPNMTVNPNNMTAIPDDEPIDDDSEPMELADRRRLDDTNTIKHVSLVGGPTNIVAPPSELEANKQVKEITKEPSLDELFAKAKQQSDLTSALMMFGKGAQRIGAGISRTAVDEKYLDELKSLISKPLDDLLSKQKLKMSKIQEDRLAFENMKLKQANDVNSPISKFYRDQLRTMAKDADYDITINEPDEDGKGSISAADIEKAFPYLIKSIDAKGIREARKLYLDSTSKDKKEEKQNKAYTELVNKAESPRGNQVLQIAKKNLHFVDAAERLLAEYPNLNDIPDDQIKILRTELARIATGSVATAHAMKEIDTPTYMAAWKKFVSKVGNKPTGAQLGQFLKNNAKYLHSLKESQQLVLNDYHKQLIKGYKDRIRPDQLEEFKQSYPSAFETRDLKVSPDEKVLVKNPQGQVGYIKKSDLQNALQQGYTLAK